MKNTAHYNVVVNNCSRYIAFEDACKKVMAKIDKKINICGFSIYTTAGKKTYFLFEKKDDCYYNISKEKIDELTAMKFGFNVALELSYFKSTLCLSIICKF